MSETNGAARPAVLLLQGGGALGSYQAGVYEALVASEYVPDWVAGISIGAINAAIIAGNPAGDRVAQLRRFWNDITAPTSHWPDPVAGPLGAWQQRASAHLALLSGQPGFFAPRYPSPWFSFAGAQSATSYYDTSPLRETLLEFVDFSLINDKAVRLAVGAVNVIDGNFVYFDNARDEIGPEHVMASGALPPALPMVKIGTDHFWDGGIVSNTPLQQVVSARPRSDSLVFQIDLWSARGEFPNTIDEALVRIKEIQYSSRTRANTDNFKRMQHVRAALAKLLPQLPPAARAGAEYELLESLADHKVYNVVHMIYRAKHHEGHSKDYEFSRQTMKDHWEAGYHDAVRTLRHPELFERPHGRSGVATFDLAIDGRE